MRMRTLLAAGAFFGVVLGSAGLVLKTPDNLDRLLGGHGGLREVREGGLRPDRRLEALQEAHLRAGSSEGTKTVASS